MFSAEGYIVRYDFSDKFKLSGGRYHTPISYWNNAFHHGYWLQTTIGRPEVIKPQSYVVPLHFLGSLLEGNLGDSNFYYRAGFGNGRSEVINDVNNFDNIYKRPAGLLGLIYRSTGRNRFESGISAYFDKPSPVGRPVVDEVILNGYFVLQSETPEIIVEYTYADHKSSQAHGNVNSVYGQFAYRLAGGESNFKLYSRIEYLNVSGANPLLGTRHLDYDGILAGVRWDFSSFAALKAEFRNEKFEKLDRQNSAWLQLALYFDASPSTQKFLTSLRELRKSNTQ